jgi:hypothetical protein
MITSKYNLPFTIGLFVWFLTAIYLSFNSVIDVFIDTDPYIAKYVFATSFSWTVVIGLTNHLRGRFFAGGPKLTGGSPKTGCKACKARQNGNV